MYKLLLIILIFTFSQFRLKSQDCTDEIKFKKLTIAILNIPGLDQFIYRLRPNEKDCVIILQNDFIKYKIDLQINEKPVMFLTKDEVVLKNIIGVIEFEKLEIVGDSAFIIFRYETQGLQCKAKFSLIDCEWKLVLRHLIEH